MATSVTPQVNLYAQQMELEAGMTELGLNRLEELSQKAKQTEREDRTVYGSSLIQGYVDTLSTAIKAFVDDAFSGRPGHRARAAVLLKDVDPDVAAYLTLKGVMQSLTQPSRLVAVTSRIATMVEDECRYQDLRKQDKDLYNWLRRELKTKVGYTAKHKVASLMTNRSEIQWENWKPKDKHQLGAKLVDLVVEHTGLIQVDTVVTQKRARGKLMKENHVVTATQATMEWIERKVEVAGLLAPVYEPMVVPPVDWEGPQGGGYLSTFVRPLKLVKTRAKGYMEELEDVEMPAVYEALNAAQQTRWKVNTPLLEVLASFWNNGSTCGGIPPRFNLELPPKPYDMDENEQSRREWRLAASKVHAENREMTSRRVQFAYTIGTATKYAEFPEIYFPYQMDFRGRIYAVPQFNPQGPDYMKALLQFAEAKPLGEEGWKWLAIHIANTGAFDKIDKAPLEDRINWVQDNEEMIIAYATDPFLNNEWTEADSPYQFLAACFEWANLAQWEETGLDASEFRSSLPIALDGSCSGIQHFSIAFRDEVGGGAVNLRNSDRPSDIYRLVAEQVTEACKSLQVSGSEEEQEFATQWLTFGITRGLCKRPTMTFGYGSRQFGFRGQILHDTLAPAYRAFQRGQGQWPFEGDGFKAANFMSKIVFQSVCQVVIKAAAAMDWLKSVAKVVANEGLPVSWTTPDGFPVLQAYREFKSRRVDTFMSGGTIRLRNSVAEETLNVDKRAQEQGISPNVIHSLDGCHLRMTVAAAAREGMNSFALVHDSFGVHAGDTARFFMLIREELVRMYEDFDVITNFREEIIDQVSEERREEITEPPAPGDLDIREILDSSYCFA